MSIIFIIILNYEKLKLIRTVKDIITIQNMSFKTKVFLKFPKSMRVFFISSIGPTTKNPITEFKENNFRNPLAINASEVEHTESKNANNIIIKREVLLSFGKYRFLSKDTIV